MIGNIFVSVFGTYYTIYIFSLIFSRKKRKTVLDTNKKLDKLRKIPVKTMEQQKEFVNLRYPKRGKFKFTWALVPRIIFKIAVFIVIYLTYSKTLEHFGILLHLWQAILIIIVGPIIINLILERFGVQKSSLLVFFK